MDNFSKLSRYLFAVAMAIFGIQHLLSALSISPKPSPPWSPAAPAVLAIVGLLLVGCSAALLIERYSRWAATGLAALLILHVVVFMVPRIIARPRDPNQIIGAFELLSMAAAALMIAYAALPISKLGLIIPRLILAAALIDFGTAHFLYAQFVATLVPAWIPARLFWAYFVGAAFCATALSLITNIQVRLAGILLGVMFLIFVVTTHAPRIVHAASNPNEWTSGFVALAMIGVSWITATTSYAAQPVSVRKNSVATATANS